MKSTLLPDGSHPALAFLNTIAGPSAGAGDGLATAGAVSEWLVGTGFISTAEARALAASPPLGRALLTEAHSLRLAMEELVDSFSRGTVLPERAVFAVNRVLDARRTGYRLVVDGLSTSLHPTPELDVPLGFLAPVARAVADLVVLGVAARTRRCASAECGIWFYDVSKNGRRRWCSMARCGNRAKVSAHYHRHKGESSDNG